MASYSSFYSVQYMIIQKTFHFPVRIMIDLPPLSLILQRKESASLHASFISISIIVSIQGDNSGMLTSFFKLCVGFVPAVVQ